MRSIQTKFILLILVGIILCSFTIGGTGIYRYSIGANNKSAETLNMLAEYNAAEINGIMGRVEQSVEVIAGCAEEFVSDPSRLSDEQYYSEYMDYLRPIMLNAAYATDDSVSVYIRLTPELSTPDAGLFYIRTGDSTEFRLEPNTDISLYEKDDIEHVGWYYIPVDNAVNNDQPATWMRPYLNKNINVYMISYVIPIFCEEELFGIVGMDIDFTMLEELVDGIRVYDTGFAYLAEDDANFTVVHHRDLEMGVNAVDENIEFVSVIDDYEVDIDNASLYDYEYGGVEKKMSYRKLNNDVNLVISAPVSEINSTRNALLLQITATTLLIAVVFVAITALICRSLVRPLRKLTKETKKIADGDMSVEIHTRSKDEVGILADSFRDMAEKLQVYIDKIHRLANTDALTGTENKAAYDAAVEKLEEQIKNGEAEFAAAVLDINGLKQTNDTMGHIYGDQLINRCVEIIRFAFPGCAVYRIGGDEFAVLLTGEEYSKREEYVMSLAAALEEDRASVGESYVALAYGVSEYRSTDSCFADAFNRADKIMYENKKAVKAASEVTE